MGRTNAEDRRRHSAATSAGMRRATERLRCPKCGRGLALIRVRDGGYFGWVCRWARKGLCDYERGHHS
jgi:hypothetical protein